MERLSSIVSNRPTVYIHGGIRGLPDDGERSVPVPHEYVVLASSIPPLSPSSTWRLFRGASAVREQLVSTEGVVGFSLLARPLRKQYATLSVWVDERALSAFADGNPHRQLVDDLSPDMGPTKFVRWTMSGSRCRPTWSEALQRLADAGKAGVGARDTHPGFSELAGRGKSSLVPVVHDGHTNGERSTGIAPSLSDLGPFSTKVPLRAPRSTMALSPTGTPDQRRCGHDPMSRTFLGADTLVRTCSDQPLCSPNGIRTRVATLRGRCWVPL